MHNVITWVVKCSDDLDILLQQNSLILVQYVLIMYTHIAISLTTTDMSIEVYLLIWSLALKQKVHLTCTKALSI